jgi:formate-dependent nitrite reductase membrane component NrfD
MGLQNVWGPLLAWYLFLAGVGAGAYLVGVVADRLGERYRPLVKPGIFLGAPLVAIGSGLLLLDLGNPFRAYLAFLRPLSSMISLGIIIITVFILLGALHMATFLFKQVKLSERALRWLGNVNAAFALGTAIYTGLLLGVVKAVPFWNTPMLPLLFLVSAVSTGMGAVLLVVGLWRWVAPKAAEAEQAQVTEAVHGLSRIDLTFVVTELLVLFFLLLIMTSSTSTAAESARYVVAGGYAVAFWLGVVVVGLLVPVTLEAWTLTRGQGMSVARLLDMGVVVGLCLLVGGIVLRYTILAAGANLAGTL